MKKWLSLAAIIVLCLALVIGIACGGEEEEEGVKEVKFGWGVPLKGLYGAAIGLPAKQGVELANEFIGEFTVAGERYKWDLIFEDNEWSAQGGVASATWLIFEDGVNIMFQIGADPAMAAQTICEESGVLLMGSFPKEALGPDKPHTFHGQRFHAPSMAAFFKYISEARPEVKTASMIQEDTATGHEIALDARMAAEYFGIEWLGEEYYPPGTTEFYPIATKMVSKNPDLCFMTTNILAPMREMGWEGTAWGMLWASALVDRYGLETVEGYLLYYPVPCGEGLPEGLRELAAEYERRYGVEFSQVPYGFLKSLYILTDALKKAGTVDDVDQIIATLETETLDTPWGPCKFGFSEVDGIGHLFGEPCSIGEIRGGEYQVVFEMSTDEAEELTLEIFAK